MFTKDQTRDSLTALALGEALASSGRSTDALEMSLISARVIIETRSKRSLMSLQSLTEAYADRVNSDKTKLRDAVTNAALAGAETVSDAHANALRYHSESGGSNSTGAITRVAPLALAARSADEADRAARKEASLTHHDLAASWSSAALVAAFWDASDPFSAAAYTIEGDPRFTEALAAAANGEDSVRDLARSDPSSAWTPMAIAIWAASSEMETLEAIKRIISFGGDASSNASVAGALLGSREGGGVSSKAISSAGYLDSEKIERINAISKSLSPVSD